MGNNLLTVLLATAKAKITPLVTKVRLWTSWNFIRTRLIAGIRNFFASILTIKPRHKRDYYEVFGWLISRRLVFATMVVLGLVSAFYLYSIRQSFGESKSITGIPTYEYDSLMLRFTKGKVRIKGKSGYLAYEGNVQSGAVNGFGILYSPDGDMVYQGNFENNKYQGNGTSYYPEGIQEYTGSFEQNKFHGIGKLYRSNGSLDYEGEFVSGIKEGSGKLYDNGNNLVYQGSFRSDRILYSELLGKNTNEVSDYYTGTRKIFESEEGMAVIMEDIGAMYLAKSNSEALDNTNKVEKILVLNNTIGMGTHTYSKMSELDQLFEEKIYEGNSVVTLAEALGINRLADTQYSPLKKVEMKINESFTDYSYVEDMEENYIVSIDSYYKDGLIYTFVRDLEEEGFLFYTIETDNEEQ